MTAKLRVTISKYHHQSCYYLKVYKYRIMFLYMSALQPFLSTFRENVALWVKYQEEITPLCLLELKRGVGWGGGGRGTKGFNKWSSCLQSSIFMKSLLPHTTPWCQLIHWPLTNQWTSKKILDQVRPSGKLPTYAYPNSTLTLTSHLGQNIRVREGVGWKLPKNLNWSVSAFFAVLQLPLHKNRQVSGERTKCT